MACEQRYRIRPVIHDGNELTVELLDASRITADAAHPLGGEGLEQGLGASVVDLDLVRLRIIRHHHGQRGAALIGMNARHTCCEHQQSRRISQNYRPKHVSSLSRGVFVNRYAREPWSRRLVHPYTR